MRSGPRVIIGIVLVTAVVINGCGGGSKNETVADVSKCLNDQREDYEVQPGKGIESTIVPDASKAIVVSFESGNDAIVVAERDSGRADAVERNFKTGSAGAAKVERHGDVVVGWTREPVDAEAAAIGDCI